MKTNLTKTQKRNLIALVILSVLTVGLEHFNAPEKIIIIFAFLDLSLMTLLGGIFLARFLGKNLPSTKKEKSEYENITKWLSISSLGLIIFFVVLPFFSGKEIIPKFLELTINLLGTAIGFTTIFWMIKFALYFIGKISFENDSEKSAKN